MREGKLGRAFLDMHDGQVVLWSSPLDSDQLGELSASTSLGGVATHDWSDEEVLHDLTPVAERSRTHSERMKTEPGWPLDL
jgi:hypothetical protein